MFKESGLFLPQGPSYLAQKEHWYAVFSFNFDSPTRGRTSDWIPEARSSSLLGAERRENFRRLYPHILGMLGNPGDVLVIAQKLPDESVQIFYAYIDWNAFPVFLWFCRIPKDDPLIWKPKLPITLGPRNISWFEKRIDRRTKLVRARLFAEGKRRQEAAEARTEAIEKSKRALYRFRYKGKQAEYRRRAKERKRLEEAQAKWKNEVLANLRWVHNELLDRREKWAAEVLANIQVFCEKLRVRRVLKDLAEKSKVEEFL